MSKLLPIGTLVRDRKSNRVCTVTHYWTYKHGGLSAPAGERPEDVPYPLIVTTIDKPTTDYTRSVDQLEVLSELPHRSLNDYAAEVARANEQWWRDLDTGEPIERNKGEMLMLIVSEVAEAMEGARKSLMDDHLPHRQMEEVELTDALIRIFDYAHHMGFDLETAYREKMAYNANRADHKPEARRQANGKKW